MIFIVQSQNNLQKIGSLNISFSYSISKGSAVQFRPFTSSALNRSIARWLGRYSPRSSRPRETGPADRPSNAKIYTLNSTIINTISKMNRRIVLKFCIRIEEKILRTFSCWHFSEKNVLHGFFWVFFGFFSSFSSLINQSLNQRPFSAWRNARSGKVHCYKNHQQSTVFRTVQKIFPPGASKVPKSAKIFFWSESFWWNCWFEQQERSARSRTIRSKIVSELWWRPKWHWLSCRRPLKKFEFFESTIRAELLRIMNFSVLCCQWPSTDRCMGQPYWNEHWALGYRLSAKIIA